MRKKNIAGGIRLPDFILLQSYSHQNSMVLAQKLTHSSMEQDRKPRNKSMHLWLINHDKGGKNMQWRKDSLFNKWCWENWTATCKKEIRTFSDSIYKNKLKWIKDLNVRLDTIKLLEENVGRTLFDINHSNIFLDPSPRVMEIKTKINE